MAQSIEEKRKYMREWQREFRKKNPGHYREQYQKHRRKNISASQKYYYENLVGSFEKKIKMLLNKARQRAKAKGIEFSITVKDLTPTTICPLLGVTLCFSNGRQNKSTSPSIDRIDPRKGYVPGNVWIISARANQIKNDASLDELKMIALNLEKELERV